jgi:hypothetical protein
LKKIKAWEGSGDEGELTEWNQLGGGGSGTMADAVGLTAPPVNRCRAGGSVPRVEMERRTAIGAAAGAAHL